MKNRLKMTESQLRKIIKVVISEELVNELDHSTIQNALLKTKYGNNRKGQYERMSKNYASRFFKQFLGKELYGCTIRDITLNIKDGSGFDFNNLSEKDYDKSFTITILSKVNEKIRIEYDHQSDHLSFASTAIKDVPMSRKDTILLSKIVSSYVPETKYVISNIHQNFTLRENMNESKLNKIIKESVRKSLKEALK